MFILCAIFSSYHQWLDFLKVRVMKYNLKMLYCVSVYTGKNNKIIISECTHYLEQMPLLLQQNEWTWRNSINIANALKLNI